MKRKILSLQIEVATATPEENNVSEFIEVKVPKGFFYSSFKLPTKPKA